MPQFLRVSCSVSRPDSTQYRRQRHHHHHHSETSSRNSAKGLRGLSFSCGKANPKSNPLPLSPSSWQPKNDSCRQNCRCPRHHQRPRLQPRPLRSNHHYYHQQSYRDARNNKKSSNGHHQRNLRENYIGSNGLSSSVNAFPRERHPCKLGSHNNSRGSHRNSNNRNRDPHYRRQDSKENQSTRYGRREFSSNQRFLVDGSNFYRPDSRVTSIPRSNSMSTSSSKNSETSRVETGRSYSRYNNGIAGKPVADKSNFLSRGKAGVSLPRSACCRESFSGCDKFFLIGSHHKKKQGPAENVEGRRCDFYGGDSKACSDDEKRKKGGEIRQKDFNKCGEIGPQNDGKRRIRLFFSINNQNNSIGNCWVI